MDDSYTTLNEKKQNVEEYILYDAIYIKFLTGSTLQSQSIICCLGIHLYVVKEPQNAWP